MNNTTTTPPIEVTPIKYEIYCLKTYRAFHDAEGKRLLFDTLAEANAKADEFNNTVCYIDGKLTFVPSLKEFIENQMHNGVTSAKISTTEYKGRRARPLFAQFARKVEAT